MTFITFPYYVFLGILFIIYYLLPLKFRWLSLLVASVGFYVWLCRDGWWIFAIMTIICYFVGILLERYNRIRKPLLAAAVVVIALPFVATKEGNFLLERVRLDHVDWIVPLGLSFFTLQMLSYMVDIYKGKIAPQRNFLKFLLFVSFFPQIVQGPIPRYSQLAEQLYEGHRFDERMFAHGALRILWGFFLKLMIADKASVIVVTIFDNYTGYAGCYFFVATILYSIQLYADFFACVTIAQGSAELFGIQLTDNFRQPYFATSFNDFWRRWHLTLSSWLKDYIYIPLGGSRKGKLRKYFNLLITFLVSGMWHGGGYKYLVWGMMHTVYQIFGAFTKPIREKLYSLCRISSDDILRKIIGIAVTYFFTIPTLVIFRAESLRAGVKMVISMYTVYNPWILFDDSLLNFGLGWKEWMVLLVSIFVLIKASLLKERGVNIRETILKQHIIVRWSIYLLTVLVIMVFGTYGYGFNAQDFIYRGF